MKAVILAAGEGTRLRPLTLETPKPLIKFCDKPIIDHILESIPEEITEIVLVVEHLKDKLKEHLGESFNNKKITYVDQGKKRGTFGALLSVKELIKDGERFIVFNGDDLHDEAEFEECLKYPRSMAVQKKVMPNYYSIMTDDSGYMKEFRPQTVEEKKNGVMVATGTYVLDSNIFKHEGILVSGGEYGLPQTVFAQKEEFPIKVVTTDKWIPINSFEDLERANKLC